MERSFIEILPLVPRDLLWQRRSSHGRDAEMNSAWHTANPPQFLLYQGGWGDTRRCHPELQRSKSPWGTFQGLFHISGSIPIKDFSTPLHYARNDKESVRDKNNTRFLLLSSRPCGEILYQRFPIKDFSTPLHYARNDKESVRDKHDKGCDFWISQCLYTYTSFSDIWMP